MGKTWKDRRDWEHKQNKKEREKFKAKRKERQGKHHFGDYKEEKDQYN